MHTIKYCCFFTLSEVAQVLLFIVNNSIQHYPFICKDLNSSKYCFFLPIIQFLHTVKQFQLFYTISFICTMSNRPKYCYVIPIIQYRHTVKGLKYYYLTLIILFHIHYLFAQSYLYTITVLKRHPYHHVIEHVYSSSWTLSWSHWRKVDEHRKLYLRSLHKGLFRNTICK